MDRVFSESIETLCISMTPFDQSGGVLFERTMMFRDDMCGIAELKDSTS
ncbi:hypothetical protein KP78_06370 [Jeotgalibacillus soli]|uniref:Uncharacterized protein n=1 Tax=Jeotgalibacillus soli TaxID=889306 RepID=A0A0C2W1Y3_9BACL|nr:hypothetical protein KP78_06370 [Jeotgalibacillus soli]